MTLDLGTPTLYVEHVPDHGTVTNSSQQTETVELPGHVYFGVEVNGVRVPLGRKATAGLLADIARAKAAAPKSGKAKSAGTSNSAS